MSTHPRNSGPRGVGPATIEIFRPCPDPPICVTGRDDAWSVCASVRVEGDALLAVLVDRDDQLLAVTAAGRDFVAAASRDPAPLIRMLDVFEAARVYMAAHLEGAAQLVELVSAELWSGDVRIEALPPLPDAA